MEQARTGADRAGAARRVRSSARRDGQVILALDRFFAERSPPFVVVATVLLVGVIFAADVATGRKLSPSLFYVLPVTLTTLRLGRRAGLLTSLLAAAAWTSSDVVSGSYVAHDVAAWWNMSVRLGVFLVIVALLATSRESMQDERDAADEAIGAADELRELNDVKDTLLHAVSHDLRGPIAAIVGSAQSLERRDQLGLERGDVDALLDGVLQSGRKLDRMVGDLLDLERLDRGLVEPDRAPTELGALVSRVVDEAMYAERHPIHVEVLEPVEMDVDAGTIERIVDNLLVNAVKYTPDRTPINVRVQRVEGGALVSVEDQGPGVADQIKAAIFQPFRQGAGARSGAGIGLSLVAKFAELHGGRAWVEDRPGGGAAFRVFLPGEVRSVPARSSSTARTARV
jgi:signal transduction histidine kinase